MKKFIVTVEIDGIITNRLVKAETAEEAERKVKEENKMIIINKNILKKLMAIADANNDDDYFYIKHYVIDQLKNCNGYDDDALYDFLWDVNALKDEILEEEE